MMEPSFPFILKKSANGIGWKSDNHRHRPSPNGSEVAVKFVNLTHPCSVGKLKVKRYK